jgi:superfamily II DNA helicase RecQ
MFSMVAPPFVVRLSSHRPNVKLSTVISKSDDDAYRFVDALASSMSSLSDRILVFVRTRADAEAFAAAIRSQTTLPHHSGLEVDVRDGNLERWRTSGAVVLVATTGLSVGLDYPHIRYVVTHKTPYSMLDFSQQSGRAGRDGKLAHSIVLVPPNLPPANTLPQSQVSMSGFAELHDALRSQTSCLVSVVNGYMDGQPDSCLAYSQETALCSRCDLQVISSLPFYLTFSL